MPKGGWETDEATAADAAMREAWEEAGIISRVTRDLGAIPDMRASSQVTNQAPRALYQFFEVAVEREEATWPEAHKRKRQWVTYPQAVQALAGRPELLEALNRSSVLR